MKTVFTFVILLTLLSTAKSQYYNLSNDSGTSMEPQVVTDSRGNVHLIWVDNTTGKNEIYYAVYGAQMPGHSIIRLGSISGGNGGCSLPRMAVDSSGSVIYVVWEASLPSGKTGIICAHFKNPILFANAPIVNDTLSVGVDSSCYYPDIAAVRGVPFVCWASNNGNVGTPLKGKLYFTRLDTSSEKWTSAVSLSDSVAMDPSAGNFWGRVTPAFNGTAFFQGSDGMYTAENLTGNSSVVVTSSSGWLPFMQGMEVVSRESQGRETVYVLYLGDGLTCECNPSLVYRVFDGNSWTDQVVIGETLTDSPAGFSLAAVSDTDIIALYVNRHWNGGTIVDTLLAAKYNGTRWSDAALLPNIAGFSQPSITVSEDGNLWMAFVGTFNEANADVLLYGNPLTSVHEISNASLPTDFYLSQNYPNPFNPSTAISYRLPAVSHVTLKVYDILGRELAMLVNGQQSAGAHVVNFNGRDLPSGVYFYRLTAGSYDAIRKMTMLK